MTPLIGACMSGSDCGQVVELLLRASADPSHVRTHLKQGTTTALICACCNGHSRKVEALVQTAVDIEATSTGTYGHCFTALHFCRDGDPRCVELLLQAGARVDAADSGGSTALYRACHRGNAYDLQIIKMLLVEGKADPNLRHERTGHTPLGCACAEGHAKVAQRLLDNGANPDAYGADGFSALMLACNEFKDPCGPECSGAVSISTARSVHNF